MLSIVQGDFAFFRRQHMIRLMSKRLNVDEKVDGSGTLACDVAGAGHGK